MGSLEIEIAEMRAKMATLQQKIKQLDEAAVKPEVRRAENPPRQIDLRQPYGPLALAPAIFAAPRENLGLGEKIAAELDQMEAEGKIHHGETAYIRVGGKSAEITMASSPRKFQASVSSLVPPDEVWFGLPPMLGPKFPARHIDGEVIATREAVRRLRQDGSDNDMRKAIAAVVAPFFDFIVTLANARGVRIPMSMPPLDALKCVAAAFQSELDAARKMKEEASDRAAREALRAERALDKADQIQNSALGIGGKLKTRQNEVQVGLQDQWGEEL